MIDYIFCTPSPRLEPVAAQVVFAEAITETECRRHLRRRPQRLSDHYRVLTTFEIGGDAALA